MTVSVKVSDFAEDIAEPILPILDALGMIGGDGNDLNLGDWDLQKAIGFIASYQRTSSLLSILDLIKDPPSIYQMYRDVDGHVTGNTSGHLDETIENWYSLFNFNLQNDASGEAGITLYRKKKDDILEDGTNCQEMILGLFVKIDGIEIGSSNPVLFDLSISFPLLHISSDTSGIITPTILLNDVISDSHRQAVSVQAKIRSSMYSRLPSDGATPSCESIQLRLAIGQDGIDVDFCLNDFLGATGQMSDVNIEIASAGEGFNPDFGQLISLVTNSLSGTISDHLLPLIGLGSDDTVPFVPQLDILNLLMDSNGPDSILDGIKSWSLAILTNPIDFESWLRHLVALLSGSDPESGFLPGDGTEGTPWGWTIPLGSDGTISFEIWMQNGPDGSTSLEFGLGGAYNKNLGIDGHNFELNLDARIASIPLVGSSSFRFLEDVSIGMVVSKDSTNLLNWSPGDLPNASVPALNAMSGTIGYVAGGVTFGSDFRLIPYLSLNDVVLGGSSPRDIDLLSGGLMGDLASLIDRPFRNTISELLINDPYLQRIGAILGLVSPRNNGVYLTRSDGWESDGTDLRIGGDMPNLSIVDFFSDPAATIGRYHRTLLEMNELPGATGDLVGIKPWAFILEAFVDIIHSIISQAQGGSSIPIRTDGSSDVIISSEGGTDGYKVTLTPPEISPPLIMEVDYTSSSGLLEILPYMGVENIPIGDWMLMDLVLSLDLATVNLPDPAVADSQSSNLCWVPGARLDATLHGLPSSTGSGNNSIPIIDVASMQMSLDSISAGLEWDRNQGIGYYVDANGFNFGGVLPDLSGLFSGLGSGFDFSQIDGLSWDGLNLYFPNGEFIRFSGPDWGWYTSDGSGGWSLSIDFPDIQWPIDIPGLPGGLTIPKLNLSGFNLGNLSGFGWDGFNLYLPSGSGKICFFGPNWGLYRSNGSGDWDFELDFPAISWPFDVDLFMGTSGVWGSIELPRLPNFNLPSINLRSLDGFDLPSLLRIFFPSLPSNTSSWDLSLFLEFPQIRGLIGKLLALRGGKFGLFLSSFFRLDIDMQMFDLGRFVGGSGFNLPEFNLPDLPDAWRIGHGGGTGFGLGPFALPIDWPEIDWPLTLSNPFEGLLDFFRRLFTGSSSTGEPFVLPALRWIWGLLTGGLPDLRLPDLGWGSDGGFGWGSIDFGNLDWSNLNWIDFDWSGLNWNSINWNSLDWSGLDWGDFDPGSLNWNSLDWNNLDLQNLDWSNLNWGNLDWGSLNLGNLNFASLNWGDLNWGDLNWGALNWGSLNSGDSNWGTIDWPNFNWSSLNWGGLNWDGLDWNIFDWGIIDWFSSGFGLGLSINIPDVPINIRGNGTYIDPWAISLTLEGVPNFEILVWLDPDGLPRIEGIQEVFSLVGDDIMDLIGDAVSSIDAPSLPDNWNTSVASMIHRLSGLHPAAAHAVGYMGLTDIQIALDRFESFLSASDGLISVDSQGDIHDSSINWSNNSPSTIHNAHHLNSLRTTSIAQEIVNFHASQGIGSDARILFVAPEWMGLDAWSDVISGLASSISTSNTLPTITDISSSGPHTLANIQSLNLSSLDHNAPFHVLVPSLNVHPDSNLPEFLAHQVKVIVDRIFEQSGEKVFLVGHSVGGLAIRYYSEGIADVAFDGSPSPPEDRVYGATTISTPHYNASQSLADTSREGLFKFMHLLRLMGSIGDTDLSSIDPSSLPLSDVLGAEGQPNLTEEYLRQLATLLFNEEVTTIFPGMDNA